MKKLILITLFCSGCVHLTSVEQKQQNVLKCVERMIVQEIQSPEAFEICRQVYKLHKIGE